MLLLLLHDAGVVERPRFDENRSVTLFRNENSGRSWRLTPGTMWVAMLQVVLGHARQRGPRQ